MRLSCPVRLLVVCIFSSLTTALAFGDVCNVPPTVQLSYPQPDQFGHGTATITYSFPNTTTQTRQLWLQLDGVNQVSIQPGSADGTWSVPFNTTCLSTGSHVLTAWAMSCRWDDAHIARSDVTVAVNTKPTVALAYVGPDDTGHVTATISYTFQNVDSSSTKQLWLQVDGVNKFTTTVSTLSGTWTIPFSAACWTTGAHTLTAWAMACQWDDGRTARDDRSIDIDTTPKITFDYVGPDSQGHGTANISYTFPDSDDVSSARDLWLQIDGVNRYHTNPGRVGVWSFPVNTTCWTPGTHTLTAWAQSCGIWDDKHIDGPKDKVLTIDDHPEVSLTYTMTDLGTGTASIVYNFPNTDASSGRHLWLQVDGVNVASTSVSTQSGTWPVAVDTSCWTTGSHLLTAWGESCGIWDDGHIQRSDQSLMVDHQPTVSLKVDLTTAQNTIVPMLIAAGDDAIPVHIHYHFPQTSTSAQRQIVLKWLPSKTNPGTVIQTWNPSDIENDIDSTVQRPAQSETLQVIATACSDLKAVDTAQIPALECCSLDTPQSSFAAPIVAANGSMRYSERDPLPGTSVEPSRVFDSGSMNSGFFGNGWASIVDSWLRVSGTAVVIGTEGNARVVFEKFGSTYKQVWPQEVSGSNSLIATTDGGYTFRDVTAGIERVYRSDGLLTRYRYLRSYDETDINWDANAHPTSLSSADGRWSWTITLNGSKIATITVDGRPDIVWSYTYDPSGNLTSVTAPDGLTWRSYTYDASGHMTAARDALGNLIESHDYAADGRAISSLQSSNDITSTQYAPSGRTTGEVLTTVTTAAGAVNHYYTRMIAGRPRTVEFDGNCASCGSGSAVYAYDTSGHLILEQDARGFITEHTYDPVSNLQISQTGPLQPSGCDPLIASDHCRLTADTIGTVSLVSNSTTSTTTYAYGDPNWPDKPILITTMSVAAAGQSRSESITYDAATGAVLTRSVTGWTGNTPVLQETHTATTTLYDGTETAAFDPGGAYSSVFTTAAQPRGFVKRFDGPRSDVADMTDSVYYPNDPAIPTTWRTRIAAVRSANGAITRFADYDVFGNAQTVTDPNGVVTTHGFDTLGRPLTMTVKAVPGCDTSADPLCATDVTSSRTYAPGGGPLASTIDANGNVTAYEYDARGRIAAISRGPAGSMQERIETSYDAATGQKSLERALAFEAGAWVEKRRESFQYDTNGRLSSITHPDTSTIVYTYDDAGLVMTIKDERHTTANTRYAYDAARRLSSVRQTLGSGEVVTQYGYDIASNLTSVADPNGNVTTYQYDDFGRMTTQISSVTNTTTYTYDPAGNLTSTTDGRGATTTRTYDALNRPLSATSDCSGSDTEIVSWTYDDATPGRFGIGRLTSMTDPSGGTDSSYERRGLLRQTQQTIGTNSYTTLYTYDAAGNRTAIGPVRYSYDWAGRPQSVSAYLCSSGCSATQVVTSVAYLPFGPEKSIAFANGTTQQWARGLRYEPLENKLLAPDGITPIADWTYGNDAAGNITAIHDTTDATRNRDFGYDDLSRLTVANSGSALWGAGSYSYDAMGNLLTATLGTRTTSLTYSGTTPLIATMTYDGAGNELKGDYTAPSSDTRTYSCRNSLAHVTITDGGTTTTRDMQYDGRGVRVHTGGTAEVFDALYTPELNLFARASASGALATTFLWLNGHPVAQIDWSTSQLRFTATDHLGTPMLQTDATGSVIWQAEYEPYGNIYQLRAGTATEQPLRLPGQEYALNGESGSEENYNIFRWYRSGWGRYTQADPMGVHGGLNIFGYTKGNPVLDFDPLGLCCGNQDYARQLLLAYSIAWSVQDTNFWSQLFSLGIFRRGASAPNGCGLNADNLVQALNSRLTCWRASRTDAGPAVFGFTCRRMIPHSFAVLSPLDRCCDARDPGMIALDNYYGPPSMTPLADPSRAPL